MNTLIMSALAATLVLTPVAAPLVAEAQATPITVSAWSDPAAANTWSWAPVRSDATLNAHMARDNHALPVALPVFEAVAQLNRPVQSAWSDAASANAWSWAPVRGDATLNAHMARDNHALPAKLPVFEAVGALVVHQQPET